MTTSKDAAARREFDEALMMASQWHQRFIDMIQLKGQVDVKDAARTAQTAEDIYLNLLNTDYKDSRVVYQLATLYMQTNRNGLAIHLLSPLCQTGAAAGHPMQAAWNNLGAAFRNEHCNAEARFAFEQALSEGDSTEVLTNLAALWVNEGTPERGIPYARRALAIDPAHPQAQWNLGLLLLEAHEYQEGFSLYANGFNTGERIIRHYKNKSGAEAPYWQGEDLSDKTIVLHGEQGIGDELLFLQFVTPLREEFPSARIILDVHPRLISAIQRSFPEIPDIFPTRKSAPEWNEVLRVDYKDGVGSLPMRYHSQRKKHAGWLKPDPVLVEFYKNCIAGIQETSGEIGRKVIGVAWHGGKKKTRTDLRSISLDEMLPILEEDATFISLQYIPGAEKGVSELLDKEGAYLHHWPDVVEDFNYDHSIALAAACDLVITVNTSIVHACGSMGHPCWTLTPFGCAWRYGTKGEDVPFYNSVRQFRKKEGETWEPVVQAVKRALVGFTGIQV